MPSLAPPVRAGLLIDGPAASLLLERIRTHYVAPFMSVRGITDYVICPLNESIHLLDFKSAHQQSIAFFYGLLFDSVQRAPNRLLTHIPRVQVVIDRTICPEVCETTHIKYSSVLLGERPVMFSVFLEPASILSLLTQPRSAGPLSRDE